MSLIVRGLTYRYTAGAPVLDRVNLDFLPGVTALLGPNGSGKTTLLRCLATVLHPTQGALIWDGTDYNADRYAIRQELGYLPQELDLPGELTPHSFLSYLARLRGKTENGLPEAALGVVGITGLAGARLDSLSGGQLRLAGLAQAILHQPRLLVLDEPLRGLGAGERAQALRVIRQPVPGRVTVFSTHIPEEAGQVADHVAILRGGRVAFAGAMAEFAALGANLEQAYLAVLEMEEGDTGPGV